ncbi:MAG: KH domain-containing protein [Candidatus Hydrogenedentota bacterium]|nr:MAG: KH domain-containing protein [Candidatus Hydrogenedentota bacterium]
MTTADPIGLVEYIVRNLVRHPDEVKITPVYLDTSLILELRVNPSDLGAVIGKNGRIARAIRNALASIRDKKIIRDDGTELSFHRIQLEIIDE